jgi:uncharacterized protein DUF6662
MKYQVICAAVLGGAALILAPGVQADERVFTYSYEAVSVLPKGGVEFEQWITYSGGKESGNFARWDLREELEFGITDRYTTALYLNFRDTHSDLTAAAGDEVDEFEFKGISSEHKFQLMNPHTKPLGMLAYGEVTTDGNELELEEKLIFQKFFGPEERWNAVFNVIAEQEWEYEADETGEESVLEFTAGVSYRLNRNWALGLEARHHRVYEGMYSDELANAWFVGPNVHYGTGKWWGTLTVLPQVAGDPDTRWGLELDEHTRIEVRLIAGYNF